MRIHGKKVIFLLILSVLLSWSLISGGRAQAEDLYEDNDTRETAWYPGYNWVRTWLSTIDGLGVQADDDWYQIEVDPGSVRLQIDCRFSHADGDIDIALHDSSGMLLADSASANDNEFIDHIISSGGTYYIRIYFGNAGNTYDLRWDDLTEDAYEENDTLGSAWHPGSNWERTWLSDIEGSGVQVDDDWYRIDVDSGSERIQVDCQFTHADGDIDIALYDSGSTLLAQSASFTDDEFIDYTGSVSGTYYVRVYKGDAGNTYNLWWDDAKEDAYEENDTWGSAWHPGFDWARIWLSTISGMGAQADDDWYMIDVSPESERIQVDCRFTHAEGDIDMALYDSGGGLLAESSSVTDNEFIDHSITSGGTYYVQVHYGNTGNTYDLRWDDMSAGFTTFVVGLGQPSAGWIEELAGNYTHEDWVEVDWSTYNSANGETRIATGDIDGDGWDEIIIGLGVGGAGRFEVLDDDNTQIAWGLIPWTNYNNANGETWPACGDLNGDGRDEIIIGLGPVAGQPYPGGYFAVFEYDAGSVNHTDWVRVQWRAYNENSGETHPACGDLDGDGRDEIVVGLGPVSGQPYPGGYFEIFDDDLSHLAWGLIRWRAYNSGNGESWPACGDLDGDGQDEIIVGLGPVAGQPYPGGYFEVFDYDAGNVIHMGWARVQWSAYNSASGETRPACGDIDGDGRDEIVVGLGPFAGEAYPGGYFEVLDDDFSHLAWGRVNWSAYNTSNGETRPAVRN